MQKVYVKIEGIHCSHCESKIIAELLKNKKINHVNIEGNIACIVYQGNLKNKEIIDSILAIDYFTKEDYISSDLQAIDNHIHFREFIFILIAIILFVVVIKRIFGFNVLNVIPTIDSGITYGMLVVTGLLTSIHCVSMCGAINLMAVVNSHTKSDFKKPLLYNLGRVISYTLIGGIVGFIGGIISINDTINGVIMVVAAVIMLLMSLHMLGIVKFKLPRLFKVKVGKGFNHSFVIGLFNGFMPCGPLQAMQVYALSTGSFIMGALSMFLFGIGTVPLMLFVGEIFHLFKGKRKILLNKVAAVLVLVLSFVMMNRGVLALGIDLTGVFYRDREFLTSVIKDNYQEVEIDLFYDHYDDIVVQKNIPVKLIIHADKKYLTGCNNEIVISEYGIKESISAGDNVIEFRPNRTGTFTMTCWMNMIKNTIKVVDHEDSF